MDALNFVNEFARLCNQNADNCLDCPLNKNGCAITRTNNEGRKILVEEVEKWSKAHPKKTRQSEFLKMFPNAKMLPTGILVCKPCEVDCGFEPNSNCSLGCNACCKNYWLQEVE